MSMIHIVGRKNHGKTLLVTELIAEGVRRGLRVASVKHCGHAHEMDTPGKDSHRHRVAGAEAVGIITPSTIAIHRQRNADDAPFDVLATWMEDVDCNLLLVEGGIDGPGLKVEVWRAEVGSEPLVRERNDIIAVITDDALDASVPIWPRNDVGDLLVRILALCTPDKA